MAYVFNSNDVFRYVWIGRNMTRTCNYIIAFLSKDRDIVLDNVRNSLEKNLDFFS